MDAVITDIPYGTTQCQWDEIIPFAPMWEQVDRVCNGAFVTTANQPFTSRLIVSNLKRFRYEMIWRKRRITGHLDAKRRPLRAHENILIFGENITYNPQMRMGENHKRGAKSKYGGQAGVYGDHRRMLTWGDKWYPQSVIEFAADPETTITLKDRPYKTKNHPTQKPIELYTYLVTTYSNPGDTILDFAMGSGTTGIACLKLGRRFIGCEISPTYYAIAEKRIREAASQLALPLAF